MYSLLLEVTMGSTRRRFICRRSFRRRLMRCIKALFNKQFLKKRRFGYSKNFEAKYELGKEISSGGFGKVYSARGRKGKLKDQPVAVKIVSKRKMKGEEWIEDVRREVKILKALSGHKHLVRFYDACEDDKHVYIVMEFCEGGTLGNRLSARKTRCTEEEAKAVIIQILSLVSFCHLQGVVHCDLKPENIIFTSAGEDADIKLIDFGISNFYRPGKSLDDPAGTALFMAPEVLQKSYGLEVDMWSIGVITYYLLGGRWPFWASTKSGIRRSVQSSNPNFDDEPWPSVSPEAKDFVKRLLSKNCLNRMSAVQALTHRWLRDKSPQIPLDIYIFRIVTGYLHTKPLRCAVRKAISKALPEDELVYLKAQFRLLEPNGDGSVSLENFKMALARNATPLMDESSWAPYILRGMEALKNRRMYFEEFCAAAISISSLEAVEGWEQITSTAFEYFEQEGNRVFSEQELCQELRIKGPSALSYVKDFIRNSDGKLNFLGFRKLLERPKPPQSKCGRKKKSLLNLIHEIIPSFFISSSFNLDLVYFLYGLDFGQH